MCTSKLSTPHPPLDWWLKARSTCMWRGKGYALHIPPPSLLGSTSSEVLGLRNRRRRQEEEQKDHHFPDLRDPPRVVGRGGFSGLHLLALKTSRQCVRSPSAYKHRGDVLHRTLKFLPQFAEVGVQLHLRPTRAPAPSLMASAARVPGAV